MDMTGEYRIAAPRQKVWEALNNTDVLKAAIPGCESIERLSPTEMTAKVSAKVGPVSARFSGKVTLSDLDPPNGYRISGEGSGGVAGFAKGGATVKLVDDGPDTLLTYTVEAQVGGKLAQIGSRLIDGTARKMAGDFFSRFANLVAETPAADVEARENANLTALTEAVSAPAAISGVAALAAGAPAVAVASAELPPVATPTATPTTPRLSPWVWVAGLIVVVAIVLYFATR